MFQVAKDARLRPDDIAKLMKLSRVTVSLWFNGHTKPHHLIAKRVDKLLAAIKSAMDAGDLPLPHDVGRRERGMYIHNTVAAHLKKLTEAEAAAKAE